MHVLKRIKAERDYYKNNFTPEERQLHANYTIDAINDLLTDFENKFISDDDNHLYRLAMINDFKDYLENSLLNM